jgi:hypothetical protein
MTVVEELRVNFLCTKAGFDMGNLSDGTELSVGERFASTGDWAGAVAACIATAGTGGHKPFLNGVRRHNRAWGDELLRLGKRALKEMQRADRQRDLSDVPTRTPTGEVDITESGFRHTERIAEWVDRLASFPPPTDRKSGSRKGSGKGSGRGDDGNEKNRSHGNEGVYGGEKGDKSGDPYKGITPSKGGVDAPKWAQLNVVKCNMPRYSKGNLGKKRIATNMGRSPRRIARLLTDPARRVFDRTTRGTGGMVIIDASGSMSFTEQQISAILENSPGATVAIYSDRGRGGKVPNFWVVAERGRMVTELPEYGWGNGVDFPAIQWGVKNKPQKNSPLIWVTDGGVCGLGDRYNDMLAIQCLTYARKHGYIIVPHVKTAIEQLRKLKNGGRAESVYPKMFATAHRNHYGTRIDGRICSEKDYD